MKIISNVTEKAPHTYKEKLSHTALKALLFPRPSKELLTKARSPS